MDNAKIKNIVDIYKNVSDFNDLIQTNILFLQNKIPFTFYYPNFVEDETVPMLAKLIKLNQYGFHSVNSQPSYSVQNDPLCIQEQKGYIYGIVEDSNKTQKLLKYLSQQKNIYYVIAYYKVNAYGSTIPIKHKDYYNVTRIKKRENESENFTNMKWIKTANLQNHYNDNILNDSLTIPNVKTVVEKCIYIQILAKKYNDFNLSIVDLLLKFYDNFKETDYKKDVCQSDDCINLVDQNTNNKYCYTHYHKYNLKINLCKNCNTVLPKTFALDKCLKCKRMEICEDFE